VKIDVRAPASTANLGPGFDCAAAALDLWNELVVEQNGSSATVEIDGEGATELSRGGEHLTLRAFARFASPDGYRFSFVNRIPLERGLGSSASAVALGLVAGAAVAGVDDKDLPPVAREIDRRRQAGRAAADDEAIEHEL